jgi:hypothetical protein
MTVCGNFVFLGSSKGIIRKFNVQSGFAKGDLKSKNCSCIIGLGLDVLNKMLVSVFVDGTIEVSIHEMHSLRLI